MDLSHTDHLHADTLGGGGVVFNKPKVTSTDEWIEVAWQSRSTRPPAFYPRMIPNLPELVDLTLRVRWFAASAMRLDAEVRHEGKEGDRKSTRSELQSLMRLTYAVFCLTNKKNEVSN